MLLYKQIIIDFVYYFVLGELSGRVDVFWLIQNVLDRTESGSFNLRFDYTQLFSPYLLLMPSLDFATGKIHFKTISRRMNR